MTFKTVFNAEYQMSHFREPVYQILADTRLESSLTKGQTVARSYTSDVIVNDMGADGSYSVQALTDTQETLVINKEKEASFYVKDLDLLQAHLPVKQKYGRKLAQKLINQIDADVLLAAYQGAGTAMDDGTFSGTAGNGHTVSSANVMQVFFTASEKLRKKHVWYNVRFQGGTRLEVPDGMPIAIISPETLTYVQLYLGGKDSMLGDQSSRNGYSGYFGGFNMFVSNSLPWTGTLTMATNPTDGDTITINGVALTFKSTLGSTAGNVKIATTVDLTRANLATALTTPGTAITEATDVGYVAVSSTDQSLLKNMTFTNSNSADTLTVVSAGWGNVVVAETLTAAANVWTTTLQKQINLFALSKSVSLVVQKEPSLTNRPSPNARIGEDFIAWTVYGIKVFVDQAPQIVSYAVNASSFTAAATTVN